MTILKLNSSSTTYYEPCGLILNLDHVSGSRKYIKIKYQLLSESLEFKHAFINMGEAHEIPCSCQHKLVVKRIIDETNVELMVI